MGVSGTPHGQQQFQTVLLVPHHIGVGTGKFLDVQRIFCQNSPTLARKKLQKSDLPKKLSM